VAIHAQGRGRWAPAPQTHLDNTALQGGHAYYFTIAMDGRIAESAVVRTRTRPGHGADQGTGSHSIPHIVQSMRSRRSGQSGCGRYCTTIQVAAAFPKAAHGRPRGTRPYELASTRAINSTRNSYCRLARHRSSKIKGVNHLALVVHGQWPRPWS